MSFYDIISYDMISYDMIPYDMISYDMISYDMISYHMISYDMISYDMISYDMIAAADAVAETCQRVNSLDGQINDSTKFLDEACHLFSLFLPSSVLWYFPVGCTLILLVFLDARF